MKKLIIATQNKNKFQEIRALLKPLNIQSLSLNDLNWKEEIIEDGNSFFENALKKAKTIAKFYNLPTLGDDSGLVVEALPNLLGIKSKRFSFEGTSKANNEKLLTLLEDKPNRKAYFVSEIVLYYPNDKYYHYIGKVYGEIANDYKGKNGFGYDPLFIVKGTNKHMAEFSEKEKNKISHRANALKQFIEDIKNEVVII